MLESTQSSTLMWSMFNWKFENALSYILSILSICFLFLDPADAIQKDSPYYEVEDSKNNKKNRRDYEKTHSLVKKHHISQIDKEGKRKIVTTISNIKLKTVSWSGFSMYLHDNGCICPRPQIVTQEKFRTSSFSGARVMPGQCHGPSLNDVEKKIISLANSDIVNAIEWSLSLRLLLKYIWNPPGLVCSIVWTGKTQKLLPFQWDNFFILNIAQARCAGG